MPWHGFTTTSLINYYKYNTSFTAPQYLLRIRGLCSCANGSEDLLPIRTAQNLNKLLLSPYWVTGFSDAESSFSLRLTKSKSSSTGWHINPIFAIELHQKDIAILEEIKNFFGVGSISIRKTRNNAVFHVQSVKDLNNVVIPHFNKYPLITQKKQILFYLVQ